jgi:hypothetical protein
MTPLDRLFTYKHASSVRQLLSSHQQDIPNARECGGGNQVADSRPLGNDSSLSGGCDERSVPLPATEVGAAVDVHYLTRHRRSVGQVQDRVRDVLNARQDAHRVE